MDLKERLNQVISIAKTKPELKSQVISDLKQRLDRIFEPKKIYRKKELLPIEKAELMALAFHFSPDK